MLEIRATFLTAADAEKARRQLADDGVLADEMTLEVAAPKLPDETAREGRAMVRIVLIIALASVVGTAIGAALGLALHIFVGPAGTSGLILQVVSWAIFAHLLIGMWAGYFLLADRTEREIGRARPVILALRCANIDPDAISARLTQLNATDIAQSAQHPGRRRRP